MVLGESNIMATENDVGTAAAAAALFHLHSSPLVTPEYNGLLKLSMPSFTLPSTTGLTSDAKEAAMSLNGMGRPRSTSWDPTFTTSASLLGFLSNNGEPDAGAAGALCALMKSDSPITVGQTMTMSNLSSSKGLRPRSQSVSAAIPASQQQTRTNRGLRPRSTSVSSTAGAPPAKRQARPRSYSTSSKASVRSGMSSRVGRRRAQSLDSMASGFEYDEDSEDDDEEDGSGESFAPNNFDELHKIGRYSPESRRKRIERFLEKRRRRIWRKRIKYDVRKNFADSRLRVKGRFVRKEDEEQLREYMAIT